MKEQRVPSAFSANYMPVRPELEHLAIEHAHVPTLTLAHEAHL